MEQRKPISTVTAGLIIGGALIVISLIQSLAGNAANQSSGWVSYLIILGGLITFIYLYGKANHNYKTFGELFSYGFKSSMMMTLVFVVFLFILSFVMPEMKDEALEVARKQMEDRGSSDEDIERAMDLTSKYFWVFAIGGTILGFLIVGAISSLIGAAVTPKRPKNPFDQPNL